MQEVKVLHLVLNDFINDSRVLKETQSLASEHYISDVYIAACWEVGLEEHVRLNAKVQVWRVPLMSKKYSKSLIVQVIKYFEWLIKIFRLYGRYNISIVHCHDIDTLPIGVLFKVFRKSKIVYDTHELATEHGLYGIKKYLVKVLESTLIHKADQVIVVSDSIADWYKKKYSLNNVNVIMNVPIRQNDHSESRILKDEYGIREDEILFIYQGILCKGRGIEILLEVFSKLDEVKHIVFMGSGNLESIIKDYESRHTNIHLHPSVKMNEIISHTKSADVGVFICENINKSYLYTMPNKIFEYTMSGLPIVVSNFPDMGRFVDDNNCGWKVQPEELKVLDLISTIDKVKIKEKRIDVLKCMLKYGWHIEEKKLKQIYEKMVNFQK
jgi:glycosyltransferase involved in cell wall biosynthesis